MWGKRSRKCGGGWQCWCRGIHWDGTGSELRVNTTLMELFLRINSIGDAGATSLAEALGVNTALMVLNLDNKYIGAAGGGVSLR
jgi:hypothetical protein